MIKDTHSIFVSEWQLDIPRGDRDVAERDVIKLPAPRTEGGKPLLEALKNRHSRRELSSRGLTPQLLSDLLWAAFGINRIETGGRTAPSAQNWHEIDIYAATQEGLFVFEPASHAVVRTSTSDIRAATGLQSFVAHAPLNLISVADFARATNATEEERRLYCVANTGFIAQNVYLFCAAQGLATVVRGAIDRAALGRTMQLMPHQHIILAQTVGYPAATH